jgi:hypothetical protein
MWQRSCLSCHELSSPHMIQDRQGGQITKTDPERFKITAYGTFTVMFLFVAGVALASTHYCESQDRARQLLIYFVALISRRILKQNRVFSSPKHQRRADVLTRSLTMCPIGSTCIGLDNLAIHLLISYSYLNYV